MIPKFGFTLLATMSTLFLTSVKSIQEGTLECVKIQRTFQWAVYLKCAEMNREFCWHPCATPKSFSDIVKVPKDCRCNPIDDKRKKRFALLNKNHGVPEKCFKPTGSDRNWFQECILDKQPNLKDAPVVSILNNVLQNGHSLWETKSFFVKLKKKLKPVVVHAFRDKKDIDDLENMMNEKFRSTLRSFSCNLARSQQTVNLYNGILNITSQIGPEDFAGKQTLMLCLLRDKTIKGQRIAIASSESRNIIHQLTQNWNENRIRYVLMNDDSAKVIFAWRIDSSDNAEQLSVILKYVHEFFVQTNGDDSRAFIDNEGATQYCVSIFGCINMSVPYAELMKHPKSKLPASLHTINAHLRSYRASTNPTFHEILHEKEACLIADNNLLFLVIHGYTNSGNDDWVQGMKDELLEKYDTATVIVVDWEEGAKGGLTTGAYYQAAVNTYAVGAIVAYTLQKNFVKSECLKADEIHVIGHSLGAQTAGFVGDSFYQSTKQRLGMITGLDPAGPWFGDQRYYLQLDKTDANYVQILHTSARSEGEEMHSPVDSVLNKEFGIRNPAGHIDFYFNGGHDQPGCSFTDGFSCSHSRAYEYFTESIASNCKFVGFRCNGDNLGEQVENCFDGFYDLGTRAVMDIKENKRTDEGLFFVVTTGTEHSFCNQTISSMYPTNR